MAFSLNGSLKFLKFAIRVRCPSMTAVRRARVRARAGARPGPAASGGVRQRPARGRAVGVQLHRPAPPAPHAVYSQPGGATDSRPRAARRDARAYPYTVRHGGALQPDIKKKSNCDLSYVSFLLL